jgi:hypothetical protein
MKQEHRVEEPPSTIGKEKLEDTPVNEEGAVLCLCISARSIREEAGLLDFSDLHASDYTKTASISLRFQITVINWRV